MSTIQLQETLKDYGLWREQLIRGMESYRAWLDRYELLTDPLNEALSGMREDLRAERLVVAFAAEFSRGKTELINSLFFSDTGVRLLPSSPGRTTMCPTEIFWDQEGGSYIRLLSIETRLSDLTLSEYKDRPLSWLEIELDHGSPVQMQEAFQELAATKKVSLEEAKKLGLYNEDMLGGRNIAPDVVEIPCWRHALISFPHYLLQEGLCILDTPGLNALGSEPELTLHMLPSAHAVVFVLAADTGVTKSDMDMWENHVRGSRHAHPGGLAVVLNKIDSMWGDLHGEEAIEESLRAQIESTAATLGVAERLIFPLTAKQALLAKVKGDNALLERSRLKSLEDYLANTVVRERRRLLHQTVHDRVGHLVDSSISAVEAELTDIRRQLEDMRKIDVKNQGMTRQLMDETRDHQSRYLASVDNFQASRRVFLVQIKLLIDALAPESIDPIIRRTRREMAGSLTTVGMKAAMKTVLTELRQIMSRAAAISEENRRMVKAIYARFHEEHGFTDVKPVLLSFRKYEVELDRIFQEGDDFRNSASSTLMEQSLVVQKLYGTIIANARELFQQAYKESVAWGGMALTPLVRKIKDHKRLIESRLEVLRKVNQSSESLDAEIEGMEQTLEPLELQYDELSEIRKQLAIDENASSANTSPPELKAAAS